MSDMAAIIFDYKNESGKGEVFIEDVVKRHMGDATSVERSRMTRYVKDAMEKPAHDRRKICTPRQRGIL